MELLKQRMCICSYLPCLSGLSTEKVILQAELGYTMYSLKTKDTLWSTVYIFYHLFSQKVTNLGTGAEKVREEKSNHTRRAFFVPVKWQGKIYPINIL